MGIMDYNEVSRIFCQMLPPDERKLSRSKSWPLQKLRAKAIHHLIDQFIEVFKNNYEAIMEGRFKGDLRSATPRTIRSALDALQRKYAILFSNKKKVIAEIGSYEQLSRMLTLYRGVVSELMLLKRHDRKFKKMSHHSQQLILLAWDVKYFNDNALRDETWWMHAVLDFVVGMTDTYIDTLATKLSL